MDLILLWRVCQFDRYRNNMDSEIVTFKESLQVNPRNNNALPDAHGSSSEGEIESESETDDFQDSQDSQGRQVKIANQRMSRSEAKEDFVKAMMGEQDKSKDE